MSAPRERLPVFVLTGFLGAGKTSLLNALLAAGGLPRTGVIVNEYGEVGLDQLFLEAAGDSLIELPDGCLCCTNRGELAASLAMFSGHDLDRVVIETSGLAEPAPVVQSMMVDPDIAGRFEPAGVVALVDAVNGAISLAEHEEARQQIIFADAIVLTKTDLTPDEKTIAELTASLRRLNARAPILTRTDRETMAELFSNRLWLDRPVAPATDHNHHDHAHGHDRGHDHQHSKVDATLLRHDRPIPTRAIEAFCELLSSAYGSGLLRVKGIVAIEESDRPLVIQGVRRIFSEPYLLERWPDEDRTTRLVVLSQNLDTALIRKLFAGFANQPLPDTADRQALTENPLAIPAGFVRR